MIERGLRHPVLGPLVLLLLACFLALVIFHTTADGVAKSAPFLCLMIIVALVVILVARPVRVLSPTRVPADRGPPGGVVGAPTTVFRPPCFESLLPLRL